MVKAGIEAYRKWEKDFLANTPKNLLPFEGHPCVASVTAIYKAMIAAAPQEPHTPNRPASYSMNVGNPGGPLPAKQEPRIGLSLPKLNDEIVEELSGTGLVVEKIGGWDWTQDAVDFVCILNSAARPRPPGESG
jgi:hypothetical protein